MPLENHSLAISIQKKNNRTDAETIKDISDAVTAAGGIGGGGGVRIIDIETLEPVYTTIPRTGDQLFIGYKYEPNLSLDDFKVCFVVIPPNYNDSGYEHGMTFSVGDWRQVDKSKDESIPEGTDQVPDPDSGLPDGLCIMECSNGLSHTLDLMYAPDTSNAPDDVIDANCGLLQIQF